MHTLEQRLGYTFKNKDMLKRALTHRSFCSEHNERLEFLGDSVLGLTMSSMLYEHFSMLNEGELSRLRAHLVKQDALYQVAFKLDLPSCMRLGEGEARSGGAKRPSILADALEAVFGAIFLEAGFEEALQVVRRLFKDLLMQPDLRLGAKDAKTALQEWLQAKKLPLPAYKITETKGHAHQQQFFVNCSIAHFSISEDGQGTSRRAAEQKAAQAVLEKLSQIHP